MILNGKADRTLIRFENKVFETEKEDDKLRLGFMQKNVGMIQLPTLHYGSGQNCDYNYYETNKITNPNGFSGRYLVQCGLRYMNSIMIKLFIILTETRSEKHR